MAWIQIKLNATNENAEIIGDMLIENTNALSVTFLDAQDTPVFEPLPGETRLWGDTDILALYDANVDTKQILQRINASGLLVDNFAYKVEQLEDKDWIREWMDSFHPMQFGEKLWICPSWRDIVDPNAINVMLDPGLAFGTGTHPTTALCLAWLASVDLVDKTVIDFGCGSGILAIAAIKLGAKKAIGIDIDPQALQASKDNAINNNILSQLELYLPDDMPQNIQADVVVANILASPLRELSFLISNLVVSNGKLAMSGVLDTQVADVASYYQDQFTLAPIQGKSEWCLISGSKLS